MSQDVTVSVIVPTYNRARYLGEAIESVLRQTRPDWELLIVDDGSKDDTRALVSRYLGDPRIRYWFQENAGQSAARNAAAAHARGRYLGFLDSDNLWLPDKLALQVPFIDAQPSLALMYSEGIPIDANGVELPFQRQPAPSFDRPLERLLRENFIPCNTVLVRRSVFEEVGGFAVDLRSGEDYDLWLRLAARGGIGFAPGLVAKYRIMDGRISSDTEGNISANFRILERFRRDHANAVSPRALRESWARLLVRRARHNSDARRSRAAVNDLVEAIRLAPLSPSPWRAFGRVLIDAMRRG